MEQKMKIKIIDDREYELTARSSEEEEIVRKAASELSRKIFSLHSRFAGRDIVDVLAFVALNQEIGIMKLRKDIQDIERETRDVDESLGSYLENIE